MIKGNKTRRHKVDMNLKPYQLYGIHPTTIGVVYKNGIKRIILNPCLPQATWCLRVFVAEPS